MHRTPLGVLLLRWQNSRTFLYVLIAPLHAASLSRAHCYKGSFRQACTKDDPTLTASATVFLLPNFTAALPRTHTVGVHAAGPWDFQHNFFVGAPPILKIKRHLLFGRHLNV